MIAVQSLMGLPVVALHEGLLLGSLNGFGFDADEGQARYLHFKGADGRADGVVPWKSVRSLGSDAITIGALSDVLESVPSAEREEVAPDVRDRPVLTESGTRIGTISGYDLDEATGQIERYHVRTGGFFGRLRHQELSFERTAVRTFGRDAVIVTDEVQRAAA